MGVYVLRSNSVTFSIILNGALLSICSTFPMTGRAEGPGGKASCLWLLMLKSYSNVKTAPIKINVPENSMIFQDRNSCCSLELKCWEIRRELIEMQPFTLLVRCWSTFCVDFTLCCGMLLSNMLSLVVILESVGYMFNFRLVWEQ